MGTYSISTKDTVFDFVKSFENWSLDENFLHCQVVTGGTSRDLIIKKSEIEFIRQKR